MAALLIFVVSLVLVAGQISGYELLSSPSEKLSHKDISTRITNRVFPIADDILHINDMFPYKATVWRNNEFADIGVIISDLWVLSTAREIYDCIASNITVMVGGRKSLFEDTEYYKVNVTSVKIHPKFNHLNPLQHDIALLMLTSKLDFSDTINKIELATSATREGTVATKLGWIIGHKGITSFSASLVVAIRTLECALQLAPTVVTYQLCTIPRAGTTGCSGNEGRALVYQNKLVGIQSWRFPCVVGNPEMFENIPYFYDWIASTTSLLQYT